MSKNSTYSNLTVRYYFKQTLLGLVLMLEYKEPGESPGMFYNKWRKAKAKDLAKSDFFNLEIK